jgi:segregation and condensation protein B
MMRLWTGRIASAWPGRDRLPYNRSLPALYRQRSEKETDAAEPGELTRDGALARVEAALLAADEPVTLRRLVAAAELNDVSEARRLLKRLQALYDLDLTAFQVVEIAGGYQLLTRPEFHPWLARLRRGGKDVRLSGPARETLAIIAYKQPVTRADIEAIRGVQCSEVLRQLMEKGLVRISGRHDSLGRPVLYGTTKKFLQVFGLKTLRDLPPAPNLQPPKREEAEPE